jgi:hypothetical protein
MVSPEFSELSTGACGLVPRDVTGVPGRDACSFKTTRGAVSVRLPIDRIFGQEHGQAGDNKNHQSDWRLSTSTGVGADAQ